jgi:SAM-dependent methyltransferase
MQRKAFTGVVNIIKFNRHFYIIALPLIILAVIAALYSGSTLKIILLIISAAAAFIIAVTLIVSWYIYDHSALYSFRWLDKLKLPEPLKLANINAGFDETSILINNKFPAASLDVFDFYDSKKHTEISIERARNAYPPYPGTKTISTDSPGLKKSSYDIIFIILAVHEIRNNSERVNFFKHLALSLKPGGRIIIVEHQRDLMNFLAFNIGFFHFHSPKTWLQNFNEAGLKVLSINKLTPFLNIYELSV